MMRQRLRERGDDERGFTLIELLVVIILIGILAAIALAVFLNQADKGKDADAKSNVNNIARLIQACTAGSEGSGDFTDCHDTASIHPQSITLDPAAPGPPSAGGDCGGAATAAVAAGFDVRLLEEGPNCFTVVGKSGSGNEFLYTKRNDGSVVRNCVTQGVKGCPASGEWAG